MGVQQIGIRAASASGVLPFVAVGAHQAEQAAIDVVGVLAVVQAGIEVDAPTRAPSRRVVTLDFQRAGACLGQVGRGRYREVMTRIEAEQMRLMAVLRILILPVVIPLLQVAVGSHAIGQKAGQRPLHLLLEVLVGLQRGGGLGGVHQAFARHGQVGRTAVGGGAHIAVGRHELILGRSAGRGHQLAVLLHEPVEAELCRPLQDRVILLEKLLVARELVALPDVGREPCAAHRPASPRGVAHVQAHGAGHGPDVRVLPQTPALVHAIVCLGRLCARAAQVGDEVHQRAVHFAQVGRLRRPIVFLQVDVRSVVAAPGRQDAFVPQALQVGGHARRARARDEQVASELEVERFERGVCLLLVRVELQLLVGGQGRYFGRSLPQVQLHAVEVVLVVGHVRRPQLVVGLGRRALHAPLHQSAVVASLAGRVLVEAVETRHVGHQHQRLACALNLQFTRGETLHATALRQHPDQRAEACPPFGVVQMFLLDAFVIRRIGMIGRITFDGHLVAGGRRGMRQLRAEREQSPDTLLACRGQAQHNHRVGRRGKVVARLRLASAEVLRPCGGVADVQRAAVGGYLGRLVQVGNGQLPQGLVVLAIVSLHLALFAVGSAVVLFVQQLADDGDGPMGVGRGHLAVGLARPEGQVVQREHVALRAAIDDGPHRAVAYHQRLLEVFRRSVVV